ncbi:hypothetical protein LZ198_28670 [Myxococcus sp. K15C18031901]|uniref:hypothetical protein n=1 Tax=Myxococcus dinghuensis TaxID=2906761 RepID=UPI0020A7C38F|nr:hypothetical protein [Myxococcus dinghuensis]MCP3102858.1 hypothetical protein [Myxococcus dinghuensis]
MSRPLLLAALLLTSAASATEPLMSQPPPKEARRTFSLWTRPLIHTALMVGGVGANVRYFAVPLGVGLRLSDSTEGSLEATYTYGNSTCAGHQEDCGVMKGLSLAAGVAWWPRPNPRGSGFYLQPQLSARRTWDRHPVRTTGPSSASVAVRTFDGTQATVGINLGYRLVGRNLRGFIEPMIGIAAGYSWGQRRNRFDWRSQYATPWGNEHGDRAVWDLNLDVFRIGLSF